MVENDQVNDIHVDSAAAHSTVRERVLNTVRRHRMIAESDTVVLAVSGGADSVAMLDALLSERGKGLPAFTAHVAHLHHGMRGEDADRDAELAREYARRAECPFHLDHVDVPARALRDGKGLEEAGREARYDFLGRLARQVGAGRVATAHHADDNLETVLMRVARGPGYRTLAGIPPVRRLARDDPILVIRPMLDCRRSELLEYLRARGLVWREDATNAALDNPRNRIRHTVLPELERLAPGLTDNLLSVMAQHRRFTEEIDRLAREALASECVRTDGRRTEVDLNRLRSLPEPVGTEVIHSLIRKRLAEEDDLTSGHLEAVLDLCRNLKGAGETQLPGGLVARRRYDKLALETRQPLPGIPEVALDLVDGRQDLSGFSGSLEIKLRAGGLNRLADFLERHKPEKALMDAGRLRGPLTMRAWKPGDRMKPLGAPGERKLQDIFTDRKTPRPERHRAPLLCLNDRPIWIVGHCMSDEVKVTETTSRTAEFTFEKRP